MSTNNTMVLFNQLDEGIGAYFLSTTNSGVDIGVCTGAGLGRNETSDKFSFTIDGGKTDYWALVVQYNKVFYSSAAVEANINSSDTYTVTANISANSDNNLQWNLAAMENNRTKVFPGDNEYWPLTRVVPVE
jgi:hypothetical protein